MAAIASPFKITYGALAVGGSSGVFQINGPHTLHKSYETLSLEFIVTVVATSFDDLNTQSNTLEEAFRDRDKTLKIDLSNILDADGASTQTYTFGTGFLNSKATCDKIGEDDEGFARDYAIHITGDLPGQDVDGAGLFTGLQDIKFDLSISASEQKTVTITGIYTATPAQTSPSRSAQKAKANYDDSTTGIDVEVAAYFFAVHTNDSFELISSDPEQDRLDHLYTFSRSYRQILSAQSATGILGPQGDPKDPDSVNDPVITDHTFTMDEIIDEPGDSDKKTARMREVEIFYECGIVLSQSVSINTAFEQRVRPHILSEFRDKFSPSQIAVARRRVKYDYTHNRMSVSMTIIYVTAGAQKVVEVSTSVRLTDTIHHKFTPRHDRNQFAFNVDRGWTDRIRTTTTLTVVIGDEGGEARIGGKGGGKLGGGEVGAVNLRGGGGTGQLGTGWVDIYEDRDATTLWVGMPSEAQFMITKINQTKIEQYFES